MTLDDLFEAYYVQYRAEADTPESTDDEYTIFTRYANESISRWANYDSTYWKELFETNQVDGSGAQTIVTGQTEYDAPDNFKEAGGFVKVLDSDDNVVQRYPIIEPQEAQFKGDDATYCYFTGNPADGYVLHLSPSPPSALSGLSIDYVYYKTPTELVNGSDITEMKNPYYIVHRALSNRFRASRNPYYQSAQKDAEDALKIMQGDNNSGSWANPWQLQDNSGSVWGK